MWEQDRLETQQRYRSRWLEFGYQPRTLGWNKDCQWVRFEAMLEGLRDEDMGSIIDFGCGFGDLLGYLRGKGWRGRYIGVDLVPELIEAARHLYQGESAAEFVCHDLQTFAPPVACDMAVAIGVFNHRLHQDNLAFVRDAIARMWQLTAKVVVCDFLSTSSDPDRRQENLFYADPREMYELAAGYSRRVMIHHAYMPFEFQVKIWHDDSFLIPAPVFGPYRSLATGQTHWMERRKNEEPLP